MGTTLRARIRAEERGDAAGQLEEAFAAVRRVEALLSTWREDTDLSRLNRSASLRPVRLAPPAFSLLEEAFAWSARTAGAFDPAVGALVDVWDLRGSGRSPSAAELRGAVAATGRDRFVLDENEMTATRTSSSAWIDAGGFGKGAALREAGSLLRDRGVTSALLDFGGQLLAIGPGPTRGPWEVGVAHPARRDQVVRRLAVTDLSVATASQSERFVEPDGRRVGHVLDPRTGYPVRAWGSVTVAAPDPLVADVLSTALFVLGPEEGFQWAADRTDVAVLFLVERPAGLEARWNGRMEPLLVGDPADHTSED